MAMVDAEFFQLTYHGDESAMCNFDALEARAEDIVGAMTRWKVTADTIAALPAVVQLLYKKAICAQIDFFAINGLESVSGGNDRGFTVGKVSVSSKYASEVKNSGAMSSNVAPLAVSYLEQTGLLNPSVPVEGLRTGWWIC